MIEETMFEAEEKMDKAVEVLKEDFAGIRTGRANPGLFNKLTVEYYGAPTPLQQLASFQNPEPRTILVIPFDKSAMHEIERAIRDSDLGVNPSSDGNQIRCVMPELTEERRREYIKLANHKAEEARVSVRNIRRKAKTDLDKLVKDGEVGEDDGTRGEKELDAIIGEYSACSNVFSSARYGRITVSDSTNTAKATPATVDEWPSSLPVRATRTDGTADVARATAVRDGLEVAGEHRQAHAVAGREVYVTHDDRVQKLMAQQGNLGDRASAPAGAPAGRETW